MSRRRCLFTAVADDGITHTQPLAGRGDSSVEMHGAILNAQTGQVDFIGQHPALDAYIDEAMYE